MRRLLLIASALSILVALAVPISLAYYLAYTEAGLQFIVTHLPRRIADVDLEIVHASGTLAGGIRIERVEIDHHLVHLRVEGLVGQIRLMPLLWQTVRSTDAYIQSVQIDTKRRTRPPGRNPPVFLPRWLMVSADHARIGSVSLSVPNGFRMHVTDLSGSALLRHKTIRFFDARMTWGDAHYSAIGALHAADPLGIEADGRIDWHPRGQPPWIISGTAKGDLSSLAVQAHITAPLRAELTGTATDLTGRFHWQGEGYLRALDVGVWGGGTALGIISGKVAVQGDASSFVARGRLVPAGLRAGEFDAEFDGTYSGHTLTARHMAARHLASKAEASGAGTFAIVPGGPVLDLHGSWQNFRWPLLGPEPLVRSERGEYTLRGALPAFNVRLQGTAAPRGVAALSGSADGTLTRQSFLANSAELEWLGGHATVHGEVRWGDDPGWSLAGRMSGLDPGRFRPDLPGSVAFSFTAQGGLEAASRAAFEFRELAGRVRGAPAAGSGRLRYSTADVEFEQLRLTLGGTSLALDGHIAKQLDLHFAISARDLALLAPDARGQLTATGSIRGSVADPALRLSAHGSGIQHAGLTLARLDAEVDFDPHAGHESQVDARAAQIAFGGRSFDAVTLRLTGRPTELLLEAALRARDFVVQAQAAGPWEGGAFKGQLRSMGIDSGASLHLQLQRPVGLTLGMDSARLEWLCLTGTPARICADADWSARHFSSTITTEQLPIATLTAGISPQTEYQGTVDMVARIVGGAGDPTTGALRIEVNEAAISHRLLSRRIEHTRFGSGTVAMTASRSFVSFDANLGSRQTGTLTMKASAQRGAADWRAMPLSGEVHARTSELNLLSLYLPDIDRAVGKMSADVQLAGTLGAPRMTGLAQLADAELDLYQVNMRLRQLGAQLRFTDRGLEFAGSARLGGGTANATGRLEWRDALPYGALDLKGTELRVVDVPEARIDASPDLHFSIAGRRIEVSGGVRVPFAKIVPKDLTGAVRASSDEVLVGSERAEAAQRFEVLSTVTLTLGDRVSVDTLGLTGRLTGSITVRSGYEAITRATGELSVLEGKYAAYARNMDIEKGQLIFTGGPLDDPGIDIRAIRKFPDVTAGVNVRGTLRQPHISFFSDPSLPQSQIASLLLSGSPQTTQYRQNVGAAGGAALVQGSAILAQQVGARVGIPDVGVQSDLLTNDTSLVLGRYLSPRLYVSYGISLTQTLNVLKLRYSLGDHWTISTEVGQARGADLVFSILK